MNTAIIANKIIDPSKLKLVEYLSIPKAFRPKTLKNFAKELGISEPTIHSWKNDPDIVDLTMNNVSKRFSDFVPDIVNALKDQAIAGSVPAIKLFLEYVTGAEFKGRQKEIYDNQRYEEEVSEEEVKRILAKLKNKKI